MGTKVFRQASNFLINISSSSGVLIAHKREGGITLSLSLLLLLLLLLYHRTETTHRIVGSAYYSSSLLLITTGLYYYRAPYRRERFTNCSRTHGTVRDVTALIRNTCTTPGKSSFIVSLPQSAANSIIRCVVLSWYSY